MLLREPRRSLHARIAEALETQFTDIAENQPELLARHCTEAGLIDKAASLWGKAGQRSLARSALVEATAQLTRARDQIAALPATPALRREQIKLQVALIAPLMYVKGLAASETKAAVERARLLIERAETLGEPLNDPLLLFSVLYGFWFVNFAAFNGDVLRDLATQFLALAEKQSATIPLMIGHRLVGTSSQCTGDFVDGRAHYDQAIALYDPASIARWRTGLVKTSAWQSCRIGRLALVDAWLSRSRTGGRGSSAQRRPRDRPCRVIDVCASYHVDDPFPPRKLCGSKLASR